MAVDIRKKEPDMNDGYALNFERDNEDYVDLGSNSEFDITGKITLECWLKTNNFNRAWGRIFSKGYDSSYQLSQYDNNGTLRFRLDFDDGTEEEIESTTNIEDGNWHHVCGTYNGNEMKIYIDGEEENSISISKTIDTDSLSLVIGCANREDKIDHFIDAIIYEARLWDIARTETEIQDNMNKKLNGNETGLVAYYKMNEGSGSTVYDSAGDNDGTINGANWYELGGEDGTLEYIISVDDGWKLDNNPSLEFDGVDDYVEKDTQLISNYPFTIEIWVKTTNSIDNIHSFVLTDKSVTNIIYGIGIRGGHGSIFVSNTNFESLSSNTDEADGEWHHIAGVFENDTTKKLYIDGLYIDTLSADVSYNSDVDRFSIGRSGDDTPGDYFEGYIDEIRIWDTARSETEINDNMNKELNGDESGLVAYYKMNENSGDTAADSAGNNDGTISGATWIDGYINWKNQDGTGTRQSPQLNLSAVGNIDSSNISWQETLNGETITIETSVDGGDTWDTCTNGDPIPNISGANTLDIKQTLETDDTTVTPVLESLTVDIDTADSNDDSGGFSATFDEKFQVVQTDEGVFTSQEDNKLLPFVFSDSGSFYKDAENWETFIFEVILDEDKLTSSIDFDTFNNWQRKPIKDEVWNKQDLPTSQWTKKDRPSTDWQKED